jgi:hypothetical protein
MLKCSVGKRHEFGAGLNCQIASSDAHCEKTGPARIESFQRGGKVTVRRPAAQTPAWQILSTEEEYKSIPAMNIRQMQIHREKKHSLRLETSQSEGLHTTGSRDAEIVRTSLGTQMDSSDKHWTNRDSSKIGI